MVPTKLNKIQLKTIFFGLCISFLFFCHQEISADDGVKIARRKPVNIENRQQGSKGTPTRRQPGGRKNPAKRTPKINMSPAQQQELQKGLMTVQEVLAKSDMILKAFEALLDKVTSVMTQKVGTSKVKNPLKVQAAIRHITEIRNMLFSIRSNIMEKVPQNPLEIPNFINGIGLHLYLSIHTAHYVHNLIKNRFRFFQPFDKELMRHMVRGQKIKHQKTVNRYIETLNNYITNIDRLLNDFDLTRTNKIARTLNDWIFAPFFKSPISDYSLHIIGATLAASYLFAWKGIAGWYLKKKEIEEWTEKGWITNAIQTDWYHLATTQPKVASTQIHNVLIKEDSVFTTEKTPQNNYVITGYNPEFQKKWNTLQKFGYWLIDKFGAPAERYKSNPGIYDPEVAKFFERNLRLLFAGKKETKLTAFDQGMTDLLSGAYPLIAVPFSMVGPTLWESWTKNIYPSIRANISVLWNKLLGGVFEEKIVEGNFEIVAHHTLDDFIGMEDEIDELKRVIEYLSNPERYSHMKKITKAFLLTGDTRTGKTFLVEAFVGSLQKKLHQIGKSPKSINTFTLPVSVIQKMGIGDILRYIKTKAPAIIFIDEVDLIGLQRNLNTPVLGDFLTQLALLLDEDPTKTIILFCATNKTENIDKALRTVGRFGKEIRFEYPAFRHRKDFLKRELKKFGIDINDIDFDRLARQLNQIPYEQMGYILNNAMMQSSIKGTRFSQDVIEKIIDIEVRKIITTNRRDLTEEKKLLAVHFAAHIVCFLLLKMAEILDSITIQAIQPKTHEEFVGSDQFRKDPDDKQKKIVYGATFANKNGDSENIMPPEILLNTIKQLISGFVAEKIVYGESSYDHHKEFYEEAKKKALNSVCKSMKFEEFPEQQKAEFMDKALKILEKCELDVWNLLNENKDLLEFMRQALLNFETLSGSEVQKLYQQFLEQKNKPSSYVETPADELETVDATIVDSEDADRPPDESANETKDNQQGGQSLELLKNTEENNNN